MCCYLLHTEDSENFKFIMGMMKGIHSYLLSPGMSDTFERIARGVPHAFHSNFWRPVAKFIEIGINGKCELLPAEIEKMLVAHKQEQQLVINCAKKARSFNNNYLVFPMDEAIYWIEYVIWSLT